MIGKAVERVGEPKVQQVDDRLQTVFSANGQCSIPERPVVVAWFWLTQAPRCAVSDDPHAEGGNRAKVVVNVGVVVTLRELVLPIGNSIGKYQRIGPFFADGPRKVREFLVAIDRIRHKGRESSGARSSSPAFARAFLSVATPKGLSSTLPRRTDSRSKSWLDRHKWPPHNKGPRNYSGPGRRSTSSLATEGVKPSQLQRPGSRLIVPRSSGFQTSDLGFRPDDRNLRSSLARSSVRRYCQQLPIRRLYS